MKRTRFSLGLAALALATVAAAADVPSPLPAHRRARFARLYADPASVDGVVARLGEALEASTGLPASEAAPLLQATAEQVLADFPDMPLGFRALIEGATHVAAWFEHPVRIRAVLAQVFLYLTEAPQGYVGAPDEVFPRVLRVVLRRSSLPVFDHAAAVRSLEASLEDLSARADLVPTALHGAALGVLASIAASGDIPPAALRLALVRGTASLGPEFPEPGRTAYLRAGLVTSGANAPLPLARRALEVFAGVAAGTDLPETDRQRLAQALAESADLEPGAAVALLRAAFEELAAAEG